MAKKHRSDALAAIHESMAALHEIGAVGKQTMRQFDAAYLTPVHRRQDLLTAQQLSICTT